MAVSIEKTGKTVQHAINDALEALGLTADEVVIEVLDEGDSGLLGIGRRPAQVRVTKDEEPVQTLPDETQLPQVDGFPEDLAEDLPSQTTDPDKTDVSEPYYGDDDNADNDEGEPETPAEAEAVAYVASILSGIGIHGRISSYRDGETVYIDVMGEDCGAAIGRHGETLDALQYLTSLVANQFSEEHVRIIVDIDGYRRRREDTLINMASRAADKVLSSGNPYRLQPMSPAERRIVHSSLQGFAGITTFSEGDDPRRRVVIAPADDI
ncbi:MAG: protein jag [Clostridia bacterium]|nr:protein jag [Clostridia bacterium]